MVCAKIISQLHIRGGGGYLPPLWWINVISNNRSHQAKTRITATANQNKGDYDKCLMRTQSENNQTARNAGKCPSTYRNFSWFCIWLVVRVEWVFLINYIKKIAVLHLSMQWIIVHFLIFLLQSGGTGVQDSVVNQLLAKVSRFWCLSIKLFRKDFLKSTLIHVPYRFFTSW